MSRRMLGIVTAGLAGLLVAFAAPAARTEAADEPKIEPKADQALKEMSKYLAGLKQFAFTAEETFDEVTESKQKIQFSNRRKVVISRPNRVAAEFEGDTGDRRFYSDGTSVWIVDRAKKSYAVIPVRKSIDEILDLANEKFGVTVPLADFLFADPYKVLTEGVQGGNYIGEHQAGGVKCHHLAYTQANVDWQIWIEAGAKPQPRKLVITYKRAAGEPQFAAVIGTIDPAPKVDDGAFRFSPPADYNRIKLLDLPGLKKGDDGKDGKP